MVRKSIVVLLLGLVALALTFSVTMAEESTTEYCHPVFDEECWVEPGDQLIIYHGWLTCRRGLIEAFLMAIEEQEYTLDGHLLWGTQETSQYWGPIEEEWVPQIESCMGHPSTGYRTYWEHELDLDPGEHELHLSLWLRHPIIDGGDWDGDGHPDWFSGHLHDATVKIHVIGD